MLYLQKKRLEQHQQLILKLSGAESADDPDFKIFYKMSLHKNGSIVNEFVKENNLHCNTDKLSAEESVMFLNLTGISGKNLAKMKVLLKRKEIDIFPSKKSIENCRKELLKDIEFDYGRMLLFKDTKGDESISSPYAKVKDLKLMVETSLQKYKPEELLEVKGKKVIVFSGDKGGNVGHKANYAKFGFTCVLKKDPQNVNNYHNYGLYVGSDHQENMKKFHSEYTNDLLILSLTEIPLYGFFHIFLTGDVAHISAMTGHQGAAASFPSPFTTTPLDHFRKYHENNEPHNRENINCFHEDTFRKVKDNISEYMESIANDPKLIRKGGKNASSIIGELLHPIPYGKRIIDGVIPPGLHLVQGLFMKLLKKLLAELSEQDGKISQPEIQEQINAEIKPLNEEIEKSYIEQQQLGDEWLDCQNIVYANEVEESELVNKKDKCAAEPCTLLKTNDRYNWIACTICNKWFHSLCEGIYFNLLFK